MITDFGKQTNLIEVKDLRTPINIIGCGATGSWVTSFLLKMGFTDISVYDFDKIEEHNLPNQNFKEYDIGSPKVVAIYANYLQNYNEECTGFNRLKVYNKKITKENAKELKGTVLCLTDTMSSRKEIYENCYKHGFADVFIESRLGLYGGYIYTLFDKDYNKLKEYEKTLYSDNVAEEKSICGVSQTALPAAVTTASTIIMQLIKTIKKEPDVVIDNEIQFQIPEHIGMTRSF